MPCKTNKLNINMGIKSFTVLPLKLVRGQDEY